MRYNRKDLRLDGVQVSAVIAVAPLEKGVDVIPEAPHDGGTVARHDAVLLLGNVATDLIHVGDIRRLKLCPHVALLDAALHGGHLVERVDEKFTKRVDGQHVLLLVREEGELFRARRAGERLPDEQLGPKDVGRGGAVHIGAQQRAEDEAHYHAQEALVILAAVLEDLPHYAPLAGLRHRLGQHRDEGVLQVCGKGSLVEEVNVGDEVKECLWEETL